MPWCWAKRLALPGVREATATTSASGTSLNAAACRSETKPEPIRPTRTFDMMAAFLGKKVCKPACKPGSVPSLVGQPFQADVLAPARQPGKADLRRDGDGHFSSRPVARSVERPTRES